MRVKWWHVPLGLCLAVVLGCVITLGVVCVSILAKQGSSACERKGDAYYERADYEEALKWYDRGLALDRKGFFLHYGKAKALRELGRLEEAVKSFDRAIELEPDVSFPYSAKIEVLKELGRLEEAVETCDEALALMPDDWSRYNKKAEILVGLGRLEEAVGSFDRAIKLYEDEYPSSLLYGTYVKKIETLKKLGRLEDALETYDEALTRSPRNKSLRRGKGEVLVELGRYEEAARYVERPAEQAPTSPKTARARFRPPGITGSAALNSLRSSAVITRIVNQRKAGIGDIYKKYLEADPNLEGKLVVSFTVAASGAVTACSVVSSTLGNAAIDQEVCDHIMTWRFPPIDAGDVTVVYPFVFFSAGAK
jgi:TonB family protein